MSPHFQSLHDHFSRFGQEHVFQHFHRLSPADQQTFLQQLSQLDLPELDSLIAKHIRREEPFSLDFSRLEPAPWIAHPTHGGDRIQWQKARETGEQALSDGRVAVFTVAGGQGTRLGYDAPKGTFPVTPVSKSSLFEVFAGKILHASRRYGRTIPWFIMTSELNHKATLDFFDTHRFFGLDPSSVYCFTQGWMPAVDFEGKLILESPGALATNPDGHGGSLRALVRSGSVETMKKLGVDTLSYFQVDNPLVKCVDPCFIGFHLMEKSELSGKVVPKAYATEKVGHFCLYEGRNVVVEYSDLPLDLQQAHDPDGNLRFAGGSIAIHIADVAFVERLGSGKDTSASLPFHKAIKKIPYCDPDGKQVQPEKPNGVKFEMFFFDALPFANNPVLMETLRSEDFSPVKNAEGVDSPKTSRNDQLRLFASWLRDAGVDLRTDASGLPGFDFEIDTRFAMDRESFLHEWETLTPKPLIRPGAIIKVSNTV